MGTANREEEARDQGQGGADQPAPNEPNFGAPNEPNLVARQDAKPSGRDARTTTDFPILARRGSPDPAETRNRRSPNLNREVSGGLTASFNSSRAWLALAVLLAPAIAAVWLTPWFVTQDGPAHVYNAEILARSFTSDSPFRDFYHVRWLPFPNWGGHLLLAGLMRIMPTRTADLIVTSFTALGFAASIVWLRRKIRGPENPLGAILLAALLGLNITWLLGFTSFLLGACLFPILLGIWWSRRNEPNFAWIATMMVLVVVSYFCHLVSLGLTVMGIVVLALATPRVQNPSPRWGRFVGTSLGLSPLLVLGPIYLWLSRQEGGEPPFPVWVHLASPWKLSGWLAQLGWVDPISLASKVALPFTERTSFKFVFFSPMFWLMLALAFWTFGLVCLGRTNRTGDRPTPDSGPLGGELRGWWILGIFLLLGGYLGPDSFGPRHGEYLPQRLILLGFVALIPVFDADPSTRSGRATLGAIAVALAFQSLIVWDFGIYAGRTARNFAAARETVGNGERVGTLLTRTKTRFRANPLLHADNWLGVGTGNIVWSNYETRYYYFPVHFKEELNRPDPQELERLAIMEDPNDQAARAQAWERLLSKHAEAIDILVRWKEDPRLDEITERWFDPAESLGDLRVFRRRPSPLLHRGGTKKTEAGSHSSP